MSRYVEFPLEGGGSILVETPDEPSKAHSGFVKAGGEAAREAAVQASQSFDAAVENVRKSADLLATRLRALGEPPDEMEVTFSLKATGEPGHIAVGKSGADANYHVTLKWRREVKEGEKEREKDREKEGAEPLPQPPEAAEGLGRAASQ